MSPLKSYNFCLKHFIVSFRLYEIFRCLKIKNSPCISHKYKVRKKFFRFISIFFVLSRQWTYDRRYSLKSGGSALVIPDTPCTNCCERACRACMTCLALPRGSIKSSMNACSAWWARYDCLPSLITEAMMNQRSRVERQGGKGTFLVGENSERFDYRCNNWYRWTNII